jgi:hypothetical protein
MCWCWCYCLPAKTNTDHSSSRCDAMPHRPRLTPPLFYFSSSFSSIAIKKVGDEDCVMILWGKAIKQARYGSGTISTISTVRCTVGDKDWFFTSWMNHRTNRIMIIRRLNFTSRVHHVYITIIFLYCISSPKCLVFKKQRCRHVMLLQKMIVIVTRTWLLRIKP